jgi:3-hydroxyacyl-CoA dehydrogenase
MPTNKHLYPSVSNPFLIQPDRALPAEMAVIGAGNIGPDIAYFLRTGFPEKKLYLVDVEEAPLKNAEKRFQGYAQKGIAYKKLTEEQAQSLLRHEHGGGQSLDL